MQLTRISSANGKDAQRYFSHQQPWRPGQDLGWSMNTQRSPERARKFGPGAYGAHVYAQASYAAAKAIEEDKSIQSASQLAISSIQGVFSRPGLQDRPFIYDVSNISTGRSFSTQLVVARQPFEPSSKPEGPFPLSEADLPLDEVAFTSLTTFKRPTDTPSEVQERDSPQVRFAEILQSRAADEWEASPQADIDIVRETFPMKGHGSFPILDMYKVDMTGYNASKDIPDRRQLTLYRLHKPVPEDDINAHILCHAYESDRNGLIMLGNHLGYGYSLGPTATLSYSFFVHVNGDEAVMRGDGWWVQEMWWPRVSAGRCMQETRLWSPEGKHIASGYQDGMVLPAKKSKI
ncbi:thioesterase-like superfamily-domain-containing protein [Emericellopsis atlantica]|uniref:Thioesterase-like superfamily-domain-containing protein n=1 Tax=Emericellopsis atlantica TaxID=2614577 RepID=A0A9P7ZEL9_9HYPO|nr:thioesterase-like superfamily-domain-containing protein [Emericellopsis atlantica]KAG9250729.1 thioesterase-like superfamily-domain-containing protein [Emericellopsis atlantica]